MELREKAINAVLWNSVGNFSTLGIEFIVGIVLARILTPGEFGLIGTITVVIALSQVFVNSGFSQAIVRKKNCTQADYSTAFYFNLVVGVSLFMLLLFTAESISLFFNNKALEPLIQVLGFGLIISALTLIQQAKLTKEIDFKTQTRISITSSILSGISAIYLAYTGFGVWSLVAKQLINSTSSSILLWISNKWKPSLVFSSKSFKELFGFGSKLLLSGLIGTFFQNINYLIIAKYFSAQDLGYFTRAELFKNLPSQNVSGIVTTVGFPVLAKIQDDPVRMKNVFQDMLTKTFFITVILMVGMAVTAKALILSLVGEQWLPSVPLLQMLCVVGLFYPLNSMNINLLNVIGRSDLYLKLQTIIQILALPNILFGVFLGIKALILGMMLISIFGYIIFTKESNKILNYPISEQIKDNLPSLLMATVMGIVVFIVGYYSSLHSIFTLIVQIITGLVLVLIYGEMFNQRVYNSIKMIMINKLKFNIKHWSN